MTDAERFQRGLFLGLGFGGLALLVVGAGLEVERVSVLGAVVWGTGMGVGLDSIRRAGLGI